MVRGSRGRHNYIDGQLQKRSRYYIFRDWANTPDAVLAEAGPRRKVVATAPGQCLDAWQWRQPRESRTVFKNHADHVFGGQTWLDVLSQMGGCPCEFVARRARARATRDGGKEGGGKKGKAKWRGALVHAGASTPSSRVARWLSTASNGQARTQESGQPRKHT